MAKEFLDLEELTQNDGQNFLNEKGERVEVEQVGPQDFIETHEGANSPVYKEAPEKAEAYVLGRTKEIPEKAVTLIPGTWAKLRTFHTQITYYKIKWTS